MHILFVGKWPPIQGGVSRESFNFVRCALEAGHSVTVVTNANSVEAGFRVWLSKDDRNFISSLADKGLKVVDVSVDDRRELFHIPESPAYTSRITGAALNEVQLRRPDVIVGSYIEPYGVAAAQVGRVYELPTYIRHAGSDIGRLALNNNLRTYYTKLLESCDGVLTSRTERVSSLLGDLAIPDEKQMEISRDRSDLDRLSEKFPYSLKAHYDATVANKYYSDIPSRDPNDDRGVTTIGMYGKIGSSKGTFQFIKALSNVYEDVRPFRLLLIASVSEFGKSELARCFELNPNAQKFTTVLAPIANWRISGFLKQCDMAAFLENNFSVGIHRPLVAYEIAYAGCVPIVAREQISGNPLEKALVHNTNAVIIEDPNDSSAFVKNIEDALATENRLHRLQSNAKNLRSLIWGNSKPIFPGYNGILDTIERSLLNK